MSQSNGTRCRASAPVGAALALVFVLLPSAALAQSSPQPSSPPTGSGTPVHEVWTIEDGLPLSHLTGVAFASDGYLWLSSYDGLIRFDGARFSVFNTATNPELPTNRFGHIAEAPDGTLWAAAEFDHVVRWRGGAFDVFALPGVRGASIVRLQFDEHGTLWVPTNRGIFAFRGEQLEQLPGSSFGQAGGPLFWDRDGAVWVGSDGFGALRWKDDSLTRVTADDPRLSRHVTEFAVDRDGTMYLGTGTGLVSSRGVSFDPVRAEGVGETTVRAIRALSADSLLVVSDQGLLDLVDGRLSLRNSTISARTSLPIILIESRDGDRWLAIDRRVYRNEELVFDGQFPVAGLALDNEGSLWIAADGLHRLKSAAFEVYGEPEGSAANVYSIMEDSQGRIWLGSINGGTVIHEDGAFRFLTGLPALPQTMLEDRSGAVWIGQINYGACVVVEFRCARRVEYVGGHTVKAIVQDRAGNIWIGTDQGVYRDSAGSVTHFGAEDGLPHDFVRVIHEARDGSLWLGTNGGGLARYSGRRIEALTSAQGLSSDLVRSIHEDPSGVLWVGTEDRGLNRLEFPRGTSEGVPPLDEVGITVVQRGDGLYDDGVHALLDDGRGRFWMSSNRGIFWVLKSELEDFVEGRADRIHSISYTERDGLRNREANGGVQSPAIVASDGRLWFATQAGVAVVDPARIGRTDFPFPVKIEFLQPEDGLPHAPPGADGSRPVRLEPDERDFEVAYTALTFRAPENLRFQYRLEGFQDDWVEAGNRRMAFFTNVPPGSYAFHVRATMGDGVWHTVERPLSLTIAPFFHETVWFKVSMAGGLLLLGVTGFRIRDRRHRTRALELSRMVAERTATVEAQSARLKELDAVKSHFFANVSHEFRTPLTLTIGPLEDLESGMHGVLAPEVGEQVGLSLRNSRRLLRLVNQLMDVAKLEAGVVRVRAAEQDLTGFLRDMMQAFEPLAERRQVRSSFEAPQEPVPIFFDPELLERVFANIVSNAFKFTPKGGAIQTTVGSAADGWVTASVRDSGPGIPPDQLPHIFERFYQADGSRETRQAGTGIGLSLAQELVQLHGGRLEVESTPGFGTSFTVWLPTGSDHLSRDQLAPPDRTTKRPHLAGLATSSLEVDGAASQTAPTDPEPNGTDVESDDVPTVLIVEDNAEVAAYVRKHLEPRYRVVEAEDGSQALIRAREALPDVIISDVMMPRMGGLELVKALRGDRELAYVPVLLLTAKADPEHKLEALDLGAEDYLTKPFDVTELEARVRNLIETRRRLRERLSREAILHPTEIPVESSADRFLMKLRETVEDRLSDETFDVRALARAMSESRSSLYRHVMDIAGQSPSEIIRSMRLERAAQLLAGGHGSVGEIAYAVGFKSVSHFSRCFREAYGVPPSSYGQAVQS